MFILVYYCVTLYMHIYNFIFWLFSAYLSVSICQHIPIPFSILAFSNQVMFPPKKDVETEMGEGFFYLFLFIFILFLDQFSNLFPALEWVVTLGAL